MKNKRTLVSLLLLCLVAAAPELLFGQGGYTASVRGIVTDASGAAVPSARITVTDVTRGTDFHTETDAQGRYVVTALPPSSYTLSVEAPGFQTYRRNPFDLQVQQAATIDVQLQVGEVTTIVEVEASAPLLNTTIANLGQVIENRYILSLPLISRNTMALVYAAPGIVRSGGRMGGEANTNFVANGARNSSSDVLLDGVSVVNVEQNSGITQLKYTPSVDAVQEFKVQTNFFSSEFGQTGGAIVNIVTRSGTNDFHGTGYWFLRKDELNANNFFSNRAGREKPDTSRNQFGGVVGGPIKKDRMFFFSTYERTDNKGPNTQTITVPTLLQRDGDFSQTMTGSGQLIQIFNPFDTFQDASGATKRRPFANNVVPKSRWDPVTTNALEYFPEPNQPGAQFTNANNWFQQGVNSSITDQTDQKFDWNVSDNNRLTSRYSFQKNSSVPANLFGNAANTFNDGPGVSRTHNVVADWTRTHSPTTIITLRGGYLWQYGDRVPFEEFAPSQLGLPKYIDENSDFLVFPAFEPEGYRKIGSEGWLVIGREESVTQFSGSVTKILSGHSLKLGGEFRHSRLDYLQPGHPGSHYQFNRQITREDLNTGSNTQGDAIASMLLGWGSGSNFHHDPWSYSRSRYWGFYVQDDWKVGRKLTLNLGLRYDFDIPRWEAEYRESYWDLDKKSPIQVPGYDLRGVYQFTGDGNPNSVFDGDYNNFSPRLGVAYALNDKTSIRAGYGFFYMLSRATVKGHLGSAFQSTSTVRWTDDNNATKRITSLADPWPEGLNLPPGRSLGEATNIGLNASPAVRENRNPDYQSWNISIQRTLGGNAVFEVNYTGSKGTHLLFNGDTELRRLDPIYWGLGRTELNRQVPNPFFGVITDTRSRLSQRTIDLGHLLRPYQQFCCGGGAASRGDGSEAARGNSNYHALQFKYEKRFSRGLSMLAHYTWSKMIDDISHGAGNLNWLGGNTQVQDWTNLRNERALSAHDIPHRFVLTATYQLPVGKGKALGTDWGRVTNMFLGGWEVSGIWTYQSGSPLNVVQDGGTLWNTSQQRPHLIGDPDPGLSTMEKFDRNQWFNVAAFARPDPDTYGTAPRLLSYRNPHLHNLDAALFKSFAINESMRGEFRVELDNATNVTTLGFPPQNAQTQFGSTSFGTITGYASGRGPREIQLGFKFYF
jgi:hypothetical protein